MTPNTPGLPEGIVFVDFQAAGPEDFELIRKDEGNFIYKGARSGSVTGVRVKPAEGYVFIPTGEFEKVFDPKEYLQKDTHRERYTPARSIPKQTLEVTLSFVVDNQSQLDAIMLALKAIEALSGFKETKQEVSV